MVRNYTIVHTALMKQKHIHHFSTSGDTKAGIVSTVLKGRLYGYLAVKNTLGYLPKLPDLIKGCNESYHGPIGMAPNQMNF